MKINKLLIASVLAVALLGCGKREPRHIVILPDVSGSIDRESLEQAFKAIDDLAGHLQRGDRLTIIPIVGDAEAEIPGRIIRYEIPINRQAYDTDLRHFLNELNASLKKMRAGAFVHPGSRTDILGCIKVAEQEFEMDFDTSRKTLIILSDFIQEDRTRDFMYDSHLITHIAAKEYALQTSKIMKSNFNRTVVFLALMKSREYSTLAPSRREALKEFWLALFELSGAQAHFFIDGINAVRNIS